MNNTLIKDQFLWVRCRDIKLLRSLGVECFLVLNRFVMTILQDLNNFESDPEEFARTFCREMEIEDPEVGVRYPCSSYVYILMKNI